MMFPITGQIIFRHKGAAPTKDGRKLVMIVGIIAVPEDFEFKTEHQYTVIGKSNGDCSFMVLPDSGKDMTERRLATADSMLMASIWRC